MFPPNSDPGTVAAVVERGTGHSDELLHDSGSGFVAYSPLVTAYGATPTQAGKEYLKENLSRIRRLKMEEQGGRCKLCPSTGPLQLDHIEERSHGRDDRPENLQLLCLPCHGKKTGTPQWKGTI